MRNIPKQALMVAVYLAASSLSGAGFAAGGSPDPEPPWGSSDPLMEKVNPFIQQRDWPGAIVLLRDAVAASPQNAEYHNMYAYSIRKSATPNMDLVFKHYSEALRLKPDYRGAHEYIGEAYLMVNNLPKAKEHLARLDRLCTFGCEEYTDLKRAVAQYEVKKR